MILQRSDGKRREANDVYLTDRETIRRALRQFQATWKHVGPEQSLRILDPGAGTGRWGQVAREFWPNAAITGLDIRDLPPPEGYDRWLPRTSFPECLDGMGDRPEWWPAVNPMGRAFDLVLGNPPFSRAEPFIRGALSAVPRFGHVLYLFELRFLEGISRRDGLWTEHPARFVHVCSKRPSFQEDGKSNAKAFAVFEWQKSWPGPHPELTFLA